jgi:hypothetical protein
MKVRTRSKLLPSLRYPHRFPTAPAHHSLSSIDVNRSEIGTTTRRLIGAWCCSCIFSRTPYPPFPDNGWEHLGAAPYILPIVFMSITALRSDCGEDEPWAMQLAYSDNSNTLAHITRNPHQPFHTPHITPTAPAKTLCRSDATICITCSSHTRQRLLLGKGRKIDDDWAIRQ